MENAQINVMKNILTTIKTNALKTANPTAIGYIRVQSVFRNAKIMMTIYQSTESTVQVNVLKNSHI